MNVRRNRGSATVEFAASLLILLTFMLAIIDFSRMLFTWNAAAEAARAGARWAVVCDDTNQKTAVLARMQGMLPQIGDIDLAWEGPAGCTSANCLGVTVTITSLNYQWISPIAGRATKLPGITMPTFSTYLSREIMRQDPQSAAICS